MEQLSPEQPPGSQCGTGGTRTRTSGCHSSTSATTKTRTALSDPSTGAPGVPSTLNLCFVPPTPVLPRPLPSAGTAWHSSPLPLTGDGSCAQSSPQQPLWDLDADLICHCALGFSSTLIFLQPVLKKPARYLCLHSQPIE